MHGRGRVVRLVLVLNHKQVACIQAGYQSFFIFCTIRRYDILFSVAQSLSIETFNRRNLHNEDYISPYEKNTKIYLYFQNILFSTSENNSPSQCQTPQR